MTGAAEGSIMPGIIAHQMRTSSTQSLRGATAAGAASAMPGIGCIRKDIIRKYI
jgi:hypothetical protein